MPFHINSENLSFDLPQGLIAQGPLLLRSEAKLMVLDRGNESLVHKKFSDLPNFLKKGDVLVLNKTRVNPTKFFGRKKTGGRVEIIFVEENIGQGSWKALIRPEIQPGAVIGLSLGGEIEVLGRFSTGEYEIMARGMDVRKVSLERGLMPLPPYIRRSETDPRNTRDLEDYQTVFGEVPGSIAAPTAALHFTADLLKILENQGVEIISTILHIGWGTFKPVAGTIQTHQMLPEKFEIETDHLRRLYTAKGEGRRIVAVGTTVTRVLESLPSNCVIPADSVIPECLNRESMDRVTVPSNKVNNAGTVPKAFDGTERSRRLFELSKRDSCFRRNDGVRGNDGLKGETNLFIKPGYKFHWLGGLVTNFHVPKSTPIALTAAFSGLEFLTRAYAEAIAKEYRFFSYGDAMLIL